jgi:hypothetical protein
MTLIALVVDPVNVLHGVGRVEGKVSDECDDTVEAKF